MNRKVNIKISLSILLLIFGMFFSTLYGQVNWEGGERQPFGQQVSQSHQPFKAPGPGGIILPPTEEDKVGGVPVQDAYWLLSLLIVGYGIYRRKTKRIQNDTLPE